MGLLDIFLSKDKRDERSRAKNIAQIPSAAAYTARWLPNSVSVSITIAAM